MKLLTKIKNVILRKDPIQLEIEYLEKRGLHLGENVSVFTQYCFDSQWPWLIKIGSNVCISTNCKILAHDAAYSSKGYTKIGTVTIGDNVFIGSGTTVLCNTHIGDNVIIGAKSLVVGEIKSNGVYGGYLQSIYVVLRVFMINIIKILIVVEKKFLLNMLGMNGYMLPMKKKEECLKN